MADVYSICNFHKQFFVIGGEVIFDLFEEYINKVYLTEVFCRVNGDAKFATKFDRSDWRFYKEREFPKSESDDYPFRITTLLRLKPKHRYVTKDKLLRADPQVATFLDRYSSMVERTPLHTNDEEQLAML